MPDYCSFVKMMPLSIHSLNGGTEGDIHPHREVYCPNIDFSPFFCAAYLRNSCRKQQPSQLYSLIFGFSLYISVCYVMYFAVFWDVPRLSYISIWYRLCQEHPRTCRHTTVSVSGSGIPGWQRSRHTGSACLAAMPTCGFCLYVPHVSCVLWYQASRVSSSLYQI